MEVELTLKLDKTAIDSAKRYAKRYNRSLSGMVENYFKNLPLDYAYAKKHSPVVERLTGVLTEDELEKFAKEDERAQYILRTER